MVKIKICGITRLEDALAAAKAGADSIGFYFFPGSPRSITLETAKTIKAALPSEVKTVGIFRNETVDTVHEIFNETGMDMVQLQGEEDPDHPKHFFGPVIKAIRVKDKNDIKMMVDFHISFPMVDQPVAMTSNGEKAFNWKFAIEASKYGMVILSGGLTIENIQEAIKKVNPYGVDIGSGIESSPGVMDHTKMKEIIGLAKAC